jgi:PAS domain S-box-containing protein
VGAATEQVIHTPTAKNLKLVFSHFPAFATFVKENHLVDYIKEQIRLSVELDLPLMKKLAHIPEDELLELSITSHREHLEHAENNTLRKRLDDTLKMWEDDTLEIISQDDIAVEDITIGGLIRKLALMKFLPFYTTDAFSSIEIIKEIDFYESISATEASNLFIKLLRKKINEHAHFIERITNTTPGAIYVYDHELNKEIYSNNKLYDLLGYTKEDLAGMEDILQGLVCPDDLEMLQEDYRNIKNIQDGEIKIIDCRTKHKDGTYRWIRSFRSAFKRNAAGEVTQVIGISTDITDEKARAEQLKHNEELLLEAQQIASIGSYIVDVETEVIEATPQFKKIFETDNTERQNILQNMHPADRVKLDELRKNAIATNGSYDFEYRYYVNGREKIIWVNGVVSMSEGRKVLKGTVMDVTERRHMIQRLQRSEDLYKQAQALSHIGNWIWHIVSNKIEWSDELYKIHELEPGTEITPDFLRSLNHPDDSQNVQELIGKSIETKEPYDFYYRVVLKGGKTKILHARGEVMADTQGNVYKLLGTLQDVTEKQTLLERLQMSDELYKQAQSISHVGNWEWDINTNSISWSDELFRIFGLEPQSESVDFAKYTSRIHPEDRESTINCIMTSLHTHEPFENYYRIEAADGKHKIIHSRGELKTDKDNKPVKMYGICQDVTKEQHIEKHLRENEAFIQKIANTTPSLIASYNINTGKYSYINYAFEKILGYDRKIIFEQGISFFTEIVHPDDLGSLMEKNAQALEEANNNPPADGNEMIVEFKYRMRNAEGEYRWFHTYGTIFDRNADGKVENLLNVSVDITEQEEAEQALYQNNLLLKQSNSSLEEYAYVASHDLKEPLRKISTFGDRLLAVQYEQLEDEGKLYLEKIIDSAKRMQRMINDLLSISIITGNRQFENMSLQQILDDAAQTLEHKIENKQATINAKELPVARIVPSQFRQLFQNLLSNSLKFVKTGVPPEINISWQYLKPQQVTGHKLAKANQYLQLSFSDNGIGIDNAYANKIFTIFQRLHGKTEYEGTGIGLAICKKIAENHGGTIFADGKPGVGVTFTIIIPA